jgi:hypothetical protein
MVMFCDLVDSPTLSGQLDPEDYREVVQAYQETGTAVLQRFGGYIAQYLGDGMPEGRHLPPAAESPAGTATDPGRSGGLAAGRSRAAADPGGMGRPAFGRPLHAGAARLVMEQALTARLLTLLTARPEFRPRSTARTVAQLGAVLGREFAYELIQAVAPMDEAKLQRGLAQLVDAELLYQRGRPPQA